MVGSIDRPKLYCAPTDPLTEGKKEAMAPSRSALRDAVSYRWRFTAYEFSAANRIQSSIFHTERVSEDAISGIGKRLPHAIQETI